MADELLGYRIGVTSHRRGDELVAALERHGAEVIWAPALKVAPVADDTQLLDDTRAIIEQRPELVVLTTGYGVRRWREAAEAHGLGEQLDEVLRAARLVCRGGKAKGVLVAAGLTDVEDLGSITSDVVDALLARDGGLGATRVAVQLHGLGDRDSIARLEAAGAQVRTVVPYRWLEADEQGRLPELVRGVVDGRVQLLTFTVGAAVDALLSCATGIGMADELTAVMRSGRVVCAAVGPVTAVPLEELGATPVVPERFKMGALVKQVCATAAGRMTVEVTTDAGLLGVRGTGYTLQEGAAPGRQVLDDEAAGQAQGPATELVALDEAPLRVLRETARRAGESLDVARLAELTALDEQSVGQALDALARTGIARPGVLEVSAAGALLRPQAVLL